MDADDVEEDDEVDPEQQFDEQEEPEYYQASGEEGGEFQI